MDPWDLILHLCGFLAPAFGVGLLCAAGGKLFWRHRARWTLARQVALNTLTGASVLAAGMWFGGRDGRMATYFALVLAVGLVQWWGVRTPRASR